MRKSSRIKQALPWLPIGSFFSALLLFPPATILQASELPAVKPHILIILADDLGWKDVGYHGSPIRTPNIDRIAAQGIELDRFYVQPSCSPTRSGLMTGKSPARLGMFVPLNKNHPGGLPLEEKILPQYLADSGYQRFIVGKWHLGKASAAYLPTSRGFEHFYGSLTGGIGYWDKVHGGGYDLQRNGKTVREAGYVTHLVRDEVLQLIETRDTHKPLLMYVAFQAPHLPNEAPPETVKQYAGLAKNRAIHAGMVDELDQAIGAILVGFEDKGMLHNTIVLFMSDNGGLVAPSDDPQYHRTPQKLALVLAKVFDRPIPSFPFPGLEFIATNVLDGGSDNSPLLGGKTTTAEGGARVPAAIWWPGRLEGGTHSQPFTISDVLPTLLEAVGASIPSGLDGRSQLASLEGGSSETPDYLSSGVFNDLAFYRWPYKLVASEPPLLFNVIEDPTEQKNLAVQMPQKVTELQSALTNWNLPPISGTSFFDMLFDPDNFGGDEDREPWADTVGQ
ncbi:MAG: arylsulfatase A-like enzyme [Halioglobus sp.]|jgi:arylsulfatase A-like enzyme